MKELVKFKVKKDDAEVEFIFAAPSRGVIKEGEMVYAKHYAECLRNKLLTNAEALAQDRQRGGILSGEETQAFLTVVKDILLKEEELKGVKEEDTVAIESIKTQLKTLREQYGRYKSVQDSIFNLTAETKARDQLIFHYALAMIYKDGKLFFEGKDYESRLNFFESKSEDKFIQEVYARAVWYATAYISGIDNYESIPYPA